MKKVIIFDINPLYNDYILNDTDLKLYLIEDFSSLQKKSFINFIVTKINRLILYSKFFILIKFLGVKLVVSTIYNSLFISKMIDLYPEINFMIIQHYTTFEHEQKDMNKMNLGSFFCFGESQQKLLEQKHNIKNINLIGSPTFSIYKTLKPDNIKKKFKICYISQWTPSSLTNKGHVENPKISNILKLEKNLKKFLQKYDHSIVFALRSFNKDAEYEYFNSNFGERGEIYIRKNYFDTYELIEKSDVTLTGWSTCGYEAFADNNKVLFNPYDAKDLQLFNNDLCTIEDDNFDVFENKLNNLLNITENEFYEKTFKDQQKIIDKSCLKNAHLKIRENIIKSA